MTLPVRVCVSFGDRAAHLAVWLRVQSATEPPGRARKKKKWSFVFINFWRQLTRHDAWIWGSFSDTKARRAECDWRALGC